MRRSSKRDRAFAGRLREVMRLKGISPAQLARQTGIGESTVFRYLSGEREPVYGKLIAIASALDVELDFLAGRESRGKSDALRLLIDRFANDLRAGLGLSVATDGAHGTGYDTSDSAGSQAGDGRHAAAGRIPIVGKTSQGASLRFSPEGLPCGPPIGGVPRLGDDDPHAYGVIFEGDSMSSRILSGDTVICSPSTQWSSGELGLIRKVGGEIDIREISETKSSLLLRSYSPAYDLKEIDRSAVSFIHRVASIRPASRPRG